jgi:hypothetical protein
LVQPGVTGHYPGRVSPFGYPWISACSGSPRHFVACHVLLRLLAPRHPPRALCSLTFLGSSPRGKCVGRTATRHHSSLTRRIEVLFLKADHVFTWKGAAPAGAGRDADGMSSDPLAGDLEREVRGHWPGDNRDWCCGLRGARGGMVETRRLELLTLSLQRRCSSS